MLVLETRADAKALSHQDALNLWLQGCEVEFAGELICSLDQDLTGTDGRGNSAPRDHLRVCLRHRSQLRIAFHSRFSIVTEAATIVSARDGLLRDRTKLHPPNRKRQESRIKLNDNIKGDCCERRDFRTGRFSP
jgi:hypothetical protein